MLTERHLSVERICQKRRKNGFQKSSIAKEGEFKVTDAGIFNQRDPGIVCCLSIIETIAVRKTMYIFIYSPLYNAFAAFEEEPKLPPSETRALQKAMGAGGEETEEGFLPSMRRLFGNRSFLILCNSYGMSIGVLNAIATLLNQMFLIHFKVYISGASRVGGSAIKGRGGGGGEDFVLNCFGIDSRADLRAKKCSVRFSFQQRDLKRRYK